MTTDFRGIRPDIEARFWRMRKTSVAVFDWVHRTTVSMWTQDFRATFYRVLKSVVAIPRKERAVAI